MNGEFKRGEVYWIRMDGGVGSEEGSQRPGVIVSSKKGNDNSNVLNVCMLTSKEKFGAINVTTYATGKRNHIMCNQLFTFDKTRFGDFIAELSEVDMGRVDYGLRVVLELQSTEVDDRIARLEEELAKVKSEKEDELLNLKVECELHKRMYEKVLGELVHRRVMADVGADKAVVENTEVRPEKYTVEKRVEETPAAKVDINNCSEDDLVSIGFDAEVAKNVVMLQPYKDVNELKEVPGVTAAWFRVVKNRLTCTVASEKVNLNTASAKEISEKTGLSMCTAYAITGYRKREGKYGSVEDLKNVPRFLQYHWDNYASKFEV